MRIRITDIPPEGRDLAFTLEKNALNERLSLTRAEINESSVQPPEYSFTKSPEVQVNLMLEGSTVVVQGRIAGEFTTPCSRCAEDALKQLEVPISLVLKPHSERNVEGEDAEEEDLNFGIYDGEEIDCADIAEEFLVLALPFTVHCSEDCKGLCPQCGKNLNAESCNCKPEPKGDPRLSVLRELKIH